jgi:Ca-activated chloride channel family protein
MSFMSPWWLLALVGVAALVAAYLLAQRRRGRYAVRFAALPLLERVTGPGPGWRRHVPAVAFMLVTLGLVAALARPTLELQVPRERATVIVALDTSVSMEATDVDPSRIAAATAAARGFVAELPDTFNVGLVTFAGTSAVTVPPTLDRAPVLAALRNPDLASGTAIGSAVESSLEAIRALDSALDTPADEPPPARIVLLSDGANTAGSPLAQAAADAAEAGVPVSTIAYGTPDGTVDNGQRVPVDPAALAELAAGTGGTAYTAATGAELGDVYADIGSSIGYRTEQREITGWVLAAALLAALVAASTSLRWFARLP